jgi:hypothetical protein
MRLQTFGFTTAAAALVLSASVIASAATLSFSASAPTPGPDDQFFLGALSNPPGSGDASSVYMYSDRPAQGQSFTTGNNPAGYLLQAFTLLTTGDVGNTNPKTFDLRVVAPSGVLVGTPLWTDSVTSAGAIPANQYITFTLDTPLFLAANTLYGFDGAIPGNGLQINGTDDTAAYGPGTGYSSGSNGAGGTDYTVRSLDRVFVAHLTAVPEPSSLVLAAVGAIGLLGLGRRRRRVA